MASIHSSRSYLDSSAEQAVIRPVGIVLSDNTFRLFDSDYATNGNHLKKCREQLAEEKSHQRSKRKREELPQAGEENSTLTADDATAESKAKRKRGRAPSPLSESITVTNWAVGDVFDKIRQYQALVGMIGKRCSQHQQTLKRSAAAIFSVSDEERQALFNIDALLALFNLESRSRQIGSSLLAYGVSCAWHGWDDDSKNWVEYVYGGEVCGEEVATVADTQQQPTPVPPSSPIQDE
jgi:hypothetical protein